MAEVHRDQRRLLQAHVDATLFLAAGAYLAHVLAHHNDRRELLTRSILVTAFALWGVVQIAPEPRTAGTSPAQKIEMSCIGG